MAGKVLHILVCAGEEIVDTGDMGALIEEALAEMGTEKPGPARHQHTFFEVRHILSKKSASSIKTRTCGFNL
ncbi:MAG TPA: hypothetical protein VHY79_09935 [Rhizomicrobium sp.]|nr:hypothetical protein [Rhizomicrobium sp.]